MQGMSTSVIYDTPSFVLDLPPRGGFLKIVQETMKHVPFDAM